MKADVSVIIPTLNEAGPIRTLLAGLAALGQPLEIIVVDGGSEDDTVSVAKESGAMVLLGSSGRGTQLRAGAIAAAGGILWFLHADSIVPADAIPQIRKALDDVNTVGGNFALRFYGGRMSARFMTWFYPQIRKLGLLYGDSGIFVRRSTYQKVGGFKPLPLFEDLDLVTRLRKEGKLAHLDSILTTSSRRFEGRSFPIVFSRWVLYQCLYWIGVDPVRLARGYYPRGSGNSSSDRS